MTWPALFAVFVVSHLVGDFLLQTEWQALHKHGGLGPDPISRRALLTHVSTYTATFIPALIWIDAARGVLPALAAAVFIFVPHLLQDDARLIGMYMRHVKNTDPARSDVAIYVDQSMHVLVLFLLAIAVAGWN